MKNKIIKLFDDDLDKKSDENKISKGYLDDLFKENKPKEKDNSLEKILQESGNDIGTNLDTVLNNNPSQSLSDKSIFTFDNDEWNTMGKA